MDNYITGAAIKQLREKRGMTQAELADQIGVSGKAVSKWETGRGLPDISLVQPLAQALGVSVIELMNGEPVTNTNRGCNLLRGKLCVCPVCGNVLHSTGSMVARFLAEHSKAARGDQAWRDAAVYAVAHKEERDVTETFLNRLDNYKTANVKIIRALLGCSEGEAKQILADLVELDLLEELDIEDCYFVVHKEIPNGIGLFKMHVVYVLAMERRNAGKPVFEGEEMERAINELCEDPIDNGKEEEQ